MKAKRATVVGYQKARKYLWNRVCVVLAMISMRKLCFSLLLLGCVASGNAQVDSIVGTWKQCIELSETAALVVDSNYVCDEPWFVQLNEDGTIVMDKTIIYMGVEHKISGHWTRSGQTLTIQREVDCPASFGPLVFNISWINADRWAHLEAESPEGPLIIYFQRILEE